MTPSKHQKHLLIVCQDQTTGKQKQDPAVVVVARSKNHLFGKGVVGMPTKVPFRWPLSVPTPLFPEANQEQ